MKRFCQAFSSRAFWTGFGIMFLAFLGLSMPLWFASRDWGTLGQASALELSVIPIFFGGVMLVFPFGACTAYASTQVDEIRTGFMEFKLIRSNTTRYAAQQLVTNFLVSGFCVGLAFMVHAALCHLVALPSTPELYETHINPFSEDCIYYPWFNCFHGLPILLWMGFAMALTGGVWSTIGLAVAIWIPDKWMTVTLPTFVYHVLNSRPFAVITGLHIPHAADLYNDALTLPMIKQSLTYDAVLLLIFSLLYILGVKRRARFR